MIVKYDIHYYNGEDKIKNVVRIKAIDTHRVLLVLDDSVIPSNIRNSTDEELKNCYRHKIIQKIRIGKDYPFIRYAWI